MAVIYVIMVKNTLTHLLFPQKKWRNRAEARCQIVEKNPAQRFFDSLLKKTPWVFFYAIKRRTAMPDMRKAAKSAHRAAFRV